MTDFYENKKKMRAKLRSLIEQILSTPEYDLDGKKWLLPDDFISRINDIALETGFTQKSILRELILYQLSYNEEKNILVRR